jgi:hypothetical protein
MKNENSKKEYCAPKMSVIHLNHRVDLLQDSGYHKSLGMIDENEYDRA